MVYLGGLYEGMIKDGKFEGFGRRIYSSGACHEGLWRDNFPHGKGIE